MTKSFTSEPPQAQPSLRTKAAVPATCAPMSSLVRSTVALCFFAVLSNSLYIKTTTRGGNPSKHRRTRASGSSSSSSRLFLVDHLADCVQNPLIAQIYGSSAGDICLSTGVGNTSLFSGMLDQVLNIGFLVIAYFLFKRGSIYSLVDFFTSDDEGGVVVDTDNGYDDGSNGADRSDYSKRGSSKQRSVCPQCNGTGTFRADLRVDDGAGVTCDLCLGSGRVTGTPSGRPGNRMILPRSVGGDGGSKKLNEDE